MERRDIGQEILDGIREIKRHKAGEIELRHREMRNPTNVDPTPPASADTSASAAETIRSCPNPL